MNKTSHFLRSTGISLTIIMGGLFLANWIKRNEIHIDFLIGGLLGVVLLISYLVMIIRTSKQ